MEQVYQARLRANGQAVAVKVQRPGVRAAISLDIYILRRLVGFARNALRLNTDLEVYFRHLLLMNEPSISVISDAVGFRGDFATFYWFPYEFLKAGRQDLRRERSSYHQERFCWFRFGVCDTFQFVTSACSLICRVLWMNGQPASSRCALLPLSL